MNRRLKILKDKFQKPIICNIPKCERSACVKTDWPNHGAREYCQEHGSEFGLCAPPIMRIKTAFESLRESKKLAVSNLMGELNARHKEPVNAELLLRAMIALTEYVDALNAEIWEETRRIAAMLNAKG